MHFNLFWELELLLWVDLISKWQCQLPAHSALQLLRSLLHALSLLPGGGQELCAASLPLELKRCWVRILGQSSLWYPEGMGQVAV